MLTSDHKPVYASLSLSVPHVSLRDQLAAFAASTRRLWELAQGPPSLVVAPPSISLTAAAEGRALQIRCVRSGPLLLHRPLPYRGGLCLRPLPVSPTGPLLLHRPLLYRGDLCLAATLGRRASTSRRSWWTIPGRGPKGWRVRHQGTGWPRGPRAGWWGRGRRRSSRSSTSAGPTARGEDEWIRDLLRRARVAEAHRFVKKCRVPRALTPPRYPW